MSLPETQQVWAVCKMILGQARTLGLNVKVCSVSAEQADRSERGFIDTSAYRKSK